MSLLQTVKPVTAVKADAQPILKQKIGNKTVTPITASQPNMSSAGPGVSGVRQTALPTNQGFSLASAAQTAAIPSDVNSVARPESGVADFSGVSRPSAAAANVSSVAKPTVESISDVRDVNTPDVATTDVAGVGRPDVALETDVANVNQPTVTEADYTDITKPVAEAQKLTDASSVVSVLNSLLSQDNPYIRQAQQRAREEAAARGLRNSSMAVQAGQEAAISQALPLAQQDAQQSFQFERDANQQNYALDQQQYQAQLQGRRDATMQQYGLDQKQYDALVQQARDLNMQRFNLDSTQYNAALQAARDATLQQYGLDNRQFDALMNQIRDENQQQFALDQAGYQAGLNAEQQRANQEYALDQMGYGAGLTAEQRRVDQSYQMDQRQYDAALGQTRDQQLNEYQKEQLREQAQLQKERDATLNEYDKDKMTLGQQFNKELENLRNENQLGQMDKAQEFRLQELEKNASLTETRDRLLQEFDKDARTQQHGFTMEQMQKDFENRMRGMDYELSNANRLNYTNSVLQAQNAAMEQIGMIYSNPEMSPSQQEAAVRKVYEQMNANLQNLARVYDPLPGVDFEPGQGGEPGGYTPPDPVSGNPGGGPGDGTTNPYPWVPGGPNDPNYRDPRRGGLLGQDSTSPQTATQPVSTPSSTNGGLLSALPTIDPRLVSGTNPKIDPTMTDGNGRPKRAYGSI